MLEKTLGVTLSTKLPAILLMEGDFNTTNKIVYGVRMLQNARNQMPEEIFSKKTGWQMTVRCARYYSLILPDRHALPQQLL